MVEKYQIAFDPLIAGLDLNKLVIQLEIYGKRVGISVLWFLYVDGFAFFWDVGVGYL